jgi:hypothetical protein
MGDLHDKYKYKENHDGFRVHGSLNRFNFSRVGGVE